MTLLIVEDEDIIRKGLIVTLRKLEMDFEHIYEAGDGEEGLRLCREYTPDIIMTDIKMPLMDGLAFIRESQKLLPEGQFIILSGYSDFEYARTALKYGVKDYLLKPSTCLLYTSFERIQSWENAATPGSIPPSDGPRRPPVPVSYNGTAREAH